MRILPCRCDLARLWPGLLRCGTGGWPHRSRSGPQAGCDPDRPWHGAACQQEPGTLVTAEPELGQGGDTVRVAGHDGTAMTRSMRSKSRLRRKLVPSAVQVPAVHDRACGHRGLLPAGRTFPARPAPLQFPAPVMAAGGADEAVGPEPGGEMPGCQEASSGKRASKAALDMGRSYFQRLGITEH